jgi:hypothetical protein
MSDTNPSTQSIADYLAQLLKDKKQLAAFPNVFIHVERLLDEGKANLLLILLLNRSFSVQQYSEFISVTGVLLRAIYGYQRLTAMAVHG